MDADPPAQGVNIPRRSTTERVLERQHQWRELSRPIRLATVWGHAERVTDILLASGAPPAQIKSTFNGWHPRVLAPWLLRDPADSAEPADPAALSPDAIAFRFLGMALGDQAEALLSEEHRRRLRICISETAGEGETWPRLSLLAPAPGPDALGSFLANDFPRLRAALDQGGLGDRLSPHFASSIADHAIGLLAQEPDNIGAWTSLLAARRHRTAPEERDRVVDLLRHLDLRGISGADDRIGLAVAVWAADISRLLRSTEVDRAVEDQIIALSSVSVGRSGVAARAYDDADPELHPAALVGDAAIRLCRTPEAQVAAELLASIVSKLVANCPIAAPLWRQALEQIVRELPFSATAPLWPVVLQLRARSDV